MGEQLGMLDAMFLELEQFDETAHMHIGAALIFDPLPSGGTPDGAEFRDYRARGGWRCCRALPGVFSLLPMPVRSRGSRWEPTEAFDADAPRASRDIAGTGRRGRAARVAR